MEEGGEEWEGEGEWGEWGEGGERGEEGVRAAECSEAGVGYIILL